MYVTLQKETPSKFLTFPTTTFSIEEDSGSDHMTRAGWNCDKYLPTLVIHSLDIYPSMYPSQMLVL